MTIDPKTLRFAEEPLAFGPRHTIGNGIVRPVSPAQRRIDAERERRARCTRCRAVMWVARGAVVLWTLFVARYLGLI